MSFLFGIAVVSQIRAESMIRATIGTDSATDLAALAGDLYDNNTALRSEVEKLVAERSVGKPSVDLSQQSDQEAEFQRLRGFNGVAEVSGSGVRLTIDATLQPTDFLDLVNELRNAGAEAIAVGNQRVVYSTGVAGAQGSLRVNGVGLVAPFDVRAIGDPGVLDRALARKGGMLAFLRTSYPHASFPLVTIERITIPANSTPFGIRPAA